MLSLQQNQRRGQNRFLPRKGRGQKRGEVAQTMYRHVSKCKNDKIKERKKYSLFFAEMFPSSCISFTLSTVF
jgi:hypothetical protein